MPPTVAFTSGRLGRAQYLLKVSTKFAKFKQIKSRKISTAANEALELRGENLPPSMHPLTGCYYWLEGCRPDEIEVALAPDWILEQMSASKQRSSKCNSSKIRRVTTKSTNSIPNTPEVKKALLLLEVIHPKFADNYDSWIRVGMALKSISPDLLPAWDKWSQISTKYVQCECEYKWESFSQIRSTIRTLYYFASL